VSECRGCAIGRRFTEVIGTEGKDVDVDFAHFLNERFGSGGCTQAGEVERVGGGGVGLQKAESAGAQKRKVTQVASELGAEKRVGRKRSGVCGRRLKAAEQEQSPSASRRARVAIDDMQEQCGEREDP